MTFTNTNVLMSMLNNAVRAETKPAATGFKSVYIGKEKVPMNILEMTPIDSEAWRKSTSFESLCSTMRGQVDIHSVSDLVSIISHEIPIDVNSAFIESTRIKESVISSMTVIMNLTGLAFMHSGGSTAKNLVPPKLADRHADISFIQLGCCIDGKVVDSHIE